jgi:hypothetical protein
VRTLPSARSPECHQTSSRSKTGSGHAKSERRRTTWRMYWTTSWSVPTPAEQTDHQSLFETKMTNVYNMVVSGPLKRRKIAVTIDDINKRLQEVTERRRRFRPEDIVSEPAAKSTVDPRLAAMYKEATQLIGIEKPSA